MSKAKAKYRALRMPVRYLINTVLVVLLFFALQALSTGVLSTYQNKVLLLVGMTVVVLALAIKKFNAKK